MQKGFYVEVIDTVNRRSEYIKASCRAEAIEIANRYQRAQAHQWETFEYGLGDYDEVIADVWKEETA